MIQKKQKKQQKIHQKFDRFKGSLHGFLVSTPRDPEKNTHFNETTKRRNNLEFDLVD